MTPEERQRRAWRREMRREAGIAFGGLAGLLVLLISVGMLVVAWLEGRL